MVLSVHLGGPGELCRRPVEVLRDTDVFVLDVRTGGKKLPENKT